MKKDCKLYLINDNLGKTRLPMFMYYSYAQRHKNLDIAIIDFDFNYDYGNVALSIHESQPNLYNYYESFEQDKSDFAIFSLCKVRSKYFPNVDFYLAPSDSSYKHVLLNNTHFCHNIINHLIQNYDVVFVNMPYDYITDNVIIDLYKKATKVFLFTSTFITSLKRYNLLCKTFKGKNTAIYSNKDNILSKTRTVIARISDSDKDLMPLYRKIISTNTPIVGEFEDISQLQTTILYFQNWPLISDNDCKRFASIVEREEGGN